VSFLDDFVDGILGTPASIANGIKTAVGATGITGAGEKHRRDLANFISFASKVPFEDATGKIASIAIPYILNNNDAAVSRIIARKAAQGAGSTITKAAIAQQCKQHIAKASTSVAGGRAAAIGVRGALAAFTVADLAGKSGDAADRLQIRDPGLYDLLDRQGLVGGYFLIEGPINNLERQLQNA